MYVGSLLIACAHFGGYVLGSDIDAVLVHGRGKQRHLFTHISLLQEFSKGDSQWEILHSSQTQV